MLPSEPSSLLERLDDHREVLGLQQRAAAGRGERAVAEAELALAIVRADGVDEGVAAVAADERGDEADQDRECAHGLELRQDLLAALGVLLLAEQSRGLELVELAQA